MRSPRERRFSGIENWCDVGAFFAEATALKGARNPRAFGAVGNIRPPRTGKPGKHAGSRMRSQTSVSDKLCAPHTGCALPIDEANYEQSLPRKLPPMLRAGVVKRSKERAEEPCNVLRQGREEGSPPPSHQAERIANGQIALLFHPEIDSNLSIVANQAGLGIEIKGAHVEIERSDEDDLVVDTDVFGMQQPLAVKIDRDPGAQKFSIIGSLLFSEPGEAIHPE
jgi:hypothetical protein